MKIFISIITAIILLNGCGPINIGTKEITIKKLETKGYYIEALAKRGEYGFKCQANVKVINMNSNENELYIEIQAINKEKSIISIANFLIKDTKKNQIIEKVSDFSKLESCAKIEDLNIIAG